MSVNGRNPTEPRKRKKSVSPTVFVSYCHKDSHYITALIKHLKGLERRGVIAAWHDGIIRPGQEWNREIKRALSEVEIALLMISADFLASDFCYNIEMSTLLRRHEDRTCVVIPIILRECSWRLHPFAKLKVLPKDGRPIVPAYQGREDVAYTEISEAIASLALDPASYRYGPNTDGQSKPVAICPSCYLRARIGDLVRFEKGLVPLGIDMVSLGPGCPDCGARLVPIGDGVALCEKDCGYTKDLSQVSANPWCPRCRCKLRCFAKDGTEIALDVSGDDADEVVKILRAQWQQLQDRPREAD